MRLAAENQPFADDEVFPSKYLQGSKVSMRSRPVPAGSPAAVPRPVRDA